MGALSESVGHFRHLTACRRELTMTAYVSCYEDRAQAEDKQLNHDGFFQIVAG